MKIKKYLWILLFVLSVGFVWNSAGEVYAENFVPEDYGTTYAYDALGGRSNGANRKALYNDIADAAKTFWNSTENLENTVSNGEYVYDTVNYSGYGLTKEEVFETYYSFKNDNPVYYFLSLSCTYNDTNLILTVDSDYKDGSIRQEYKNCIISGINYYAAAANECVKASDKCIAIHDKLIAELDYAYDDEGKPLQDTYAHNVLGAFLYKRGVCETYARTYQLMMNYLNIDNVLVAGISLNEAHMWNLVKIEDGNYYYMDCTWDDTTNSNKYLLRGSFGFEIDHEKYTSDNTGVTYWHDIPSVSQDDFTKKFTLKKGNSVIGRFGNAQLAFSNLTDKVGEYTFEIDDFQTIVLPEGQWPEVKKISFVAPEYEGQTGGCLDIAGNVFVNSDIVLRNVSFGTHIQYLYSNKACATMDIRSYSMSLTGSQCRNGYLVLLAVEGYQSNGTGVNIKGSAGSRLNLEAFSEERTDYINVDKIIINSEELSSVGTDIFANEILYFSSDETHSPSIRFFNDLEYNVKKTVISDDSYVFMHLQDCSENTIISNGIVSGNGEKLSISMSCSTGSFPKISIDNSEVSISLGILNYEVHEFAGETEYDIWDGLENYRGSVINIGKTPMDKIVEITYQVRKIDENGMFYYANTVSNICALFVKEENGDVWRKYDENFYIVGDTLMGYHYMDRVKKTSLVIPSTVKKIHAFTFYDTAGKNNIQSITIPSSVTTIGEFAFSGCENLKELYVPSSVTQIDGYGIGYRIDNGDGYLYKGFKLMCLYGTEAYQYAINYNVPIKLIPSNVKSIAVDAKTYNSVTLKWAENRGATKFVVKQYKDGKWVVVKTTTTNSAKITGLSPSKTYEFQVISVVEDSFGVRYGDTPAGISATTTAKPVPKVTGLKYTATNNSVTLKWTKVANANGYTIKQYKNGKWVTIKTTTSNSVKITGLSASKTYKFQVVAFVKEGTITRYGTFPTSLTSVTVPSPVSNLKAAKKSKTSVKLTWKKNTTAAGYVVERKKAGKWVKISTIKKNSTTSYTVKSLKKGTKYSFRVKSYKKIGRKTYYSSYRYVKISL